MESKTCTKCKQSKPKNSDVFRFREKNCTRRNGERYIYYWVNSICRECEILSNKAYKKRQRIDKWGIEESEYKAHVAEIKRNVALNMSQMNIKFKDAKIKLSGNDYRYFREKKQKNPELTVKQYLEEKSTIKERLIKRIVLLNKSRKKYFTEKEKIDAKLIHGKQARSNFIKRCSDTYIILNILKTKGFVPKELIESKRLVIQLKRELKNANQ